MSAGASQVARPAQEARPAQAARAAQEARPAQAVDAAQAGQSECVGDVCITCSDAAVAVTVLRLLDDELAVVDTAAGEEEVSVALVTASVGDTILVHAGEAIAIVPR
jgi:hydrogenase expression/formation protein HypC